MATGPAASDCAKVDWSGLTKAVGSYRRVPSTKTAAAIRRLLPVAQDVCLGEATPIEAARFYQAVERALPTLERRLLARDQAAAQVTFELRKVADGGLLEDLSFVLAKLVVADPGLFLAELRPHPEQAYVAAMLGPEFVDQTAAVLCVEIHRRIKALEAVTDASLAPVKALALKELRKGPPECE